MKLEFNKEDLSNILCFENMYEDEEVSDDEMVGFDLVGNFDNLLIKSEYFEDKQDIENYKENEYNGWFEFSIYLKENFGDLVLRIRPYNEDLFNPKEFTLYGNGVDDLKTNVVILMSSEIARR